MLEQLADIFTTIAVITGGILVVVFVGIMLSDYLDD
jgi:hypothetical protein